MKGALVVVAGGGLAIIAAVFAAGASVGNGPGGAALGLSLAKGLIPADYQELVEDNGHRCEGLSPQVLAALLQQESGFNPRAKSPAKAYGIAQFLKGTWAANAVDGDGDGDRDIWDPEDAIPSAAEYLCKNIDAVKDVPGDPVVNALAAYNAGPGAVQKYGGVPPYRETQNYVKTITASAKTFTNASKKSGTSKVVPVSAPRTESERAQMAAEAVNSAQEHLGKPYVWGGDGDAEGGFDCSGLTKAAYAKAGVTLPRVANQQWDTGKHPARDELAPGDLVFFATDKNNPDSIHHVGLYVGGGYMLNAPRPGAVIRFDPIDLPDYYGATRVAPEKGIQA